MADAAAAQVGLGAGGVRGRVKAWEELCKQRKPEPIVPRKKKNETAQARTPVKADTLRTPEKPEEPKVQSPAAKYQWRLENISEQGVIKAGVTSLYEQLAAPLGEALYELPRRSGGTGPPLVLQSFFMNRLLRQETELKSCPPSDVVAAQVDLRHLSREQLLHLRSTTLDFFTDSESHQSHNGFLATVDAHMFEKLGRAALQEQPPDPPTPSSAGADPRAPRSSKFYALGVQLAALRGAIELIKADAAESGSEGHEKLPDLWIVYLNSSDWNDAKFAVFRNEDFRATILEDEKPDWRRVAGGSKIAVVTERNRETAQGKRIFWLIAALDSQTDDVMEAVERAAPTRSQRCMSQELDDALKHRCTRAGNSDEDTSGMGSQHELAASQA